MSRSTKLIAAAAAALAGLAWLAFGFFGIHTAFIDNEVNEANPFASALAASTEPAPVTQTAPLAQPVEADTNDQVEAVTVAGPDVDEPAAEAATADAPAEAAAAGAPVAPATDPDAAPAVPEPEAAVEAVEAAAPAEVATAPEVAAAPAEAPAEPEPPAEPATPQIVTLASGSLVDHAHSGQGTINVLTDGNQTFLRFEDDFAVDNGPDLNVYLVRGADANGDPGLFDDDFIDLGDLKGNIGAQNYEVPAGVDLTEYDTVVIWCVRFGIAFNAANLA